MDFLTIRYIFVTFLLLFTIPCGVASSATTAEDGEKLTILYSNNVGGELEPCG